MIHRSRPQSRRDRSRAARLVVAVPVALLSLALSACAGERSEGGPIRVGFILQESAGTSALHGAELGAEEAAHAGELVGRELRLLTERADSPDDVDQAARRLIAAGAVAIIGGFDDASCRTLSDVAEESKVLFLNVGCRADALRTDTRPHTVHLEASRGMYDAAIGRFGREAVLWHGELSRFGAAQLNDRFESRFGSASDAAGWASWMAVKVVWESYARGSRDDADSILGFLVSPETRFDGHKGEPLGFEPRTRQLQQPLFPRPGGPATSGGESEALEHHAALPLASEIDLHDGPYLFVSNEGSVDVSVVDLRSGGAVARVPMVRRPRGIHLDASGRRLYVALSDDAPRVENDADGIAIFDLERGGEVARFPVGSDPEQFAIAPDGRRLYASNEDAGTATATDLASGRVVYTVVVGIEPEGVAASPDGRWVYVTAETSNTVSVIDTQSEQVAASFLVDVRPRGVAFSPSGERAYVTNEISGTLSVVDARQHRVVAAVDLGEAAKPVGVVVSPDGKRVFIANGHANNIAVVDAAINRMIATIPTGRRPWGITISPDGAYVYTANGGSNDVSEVDVAALKVVRTIQVGDRPWGLAYRPRP